MNKLARNIFLITSFPIIIICGCSTTDFRKFDGHIEEFAQGNNYKGTFRRVESSKVLLEIFKFSGSFLNPTVWGAYSLFIEGPADIFQPNTIIEIPNNKIKTFYYSDYHHTGTLKKNLIGSIKIIDVNKRFIIADINLKLEDSNETFDIKAKFRYRDISKYNRIER